MLLHKHVNVKKDKEYLHLGTRFQTNCLHSLKLNFQKLKTFIVFRLKSFCLSTVMLTIAHTRVVWEVLRILSYLLNFLFLIHNIWHILRLAYHRTILRN